jgi:alpha-galactosidase
MTINRREFMQASVAAYLLSRAVRMRAQTAPAYVNNGSDMHHWNIGNSLVERRVQFDPKVGLFTPSWKSLLTGTEFIRPIRPDELHPNTRGEEFSFQADGEQIDGSGGAFDLIDTATHEVQPRGKALEFKLKSRTKPIEVSVFYAVYEGHPVIRKWIAATNRGDKAIALSHFMFEAVPMLVGKPSEVQAQGFYGVQPRESAFTGSVYDCAVVERNSRTGEGFIAMNEAPGYTKHIQLPTWDGGIRVMYDTDLFPFERTLAPGETFTSPKSSIAFVMEGRGFADPRWVMPSYTSQVLMKKGAAFKPLWNYNAYLPFKLDINAETVRELVPIAARMGFDVFTIDGGWERFQGDFEPSPKNFPGGFDAIQKEVERQGMRFGLWASLAIVQSESQVYRDHPEWACRSADGKIKGSATDFGQTPVMCFDSPYREFAARRLSDLISRYNLKYVKLDQTTVFNVYGEAPGCYALGHHHRNWAESLQGIYEGIQYFTDYIYRQHPDVLLDMTFEAWGAMHLIDYGLIATADVDWVSNVADRSPDASGPRQARTILYERSLAIPAETMLLGCTRAETLPLEERFATSISAGPVLTGDLRKLTPQQQDWWGKQIRWHKKLRSEVALNESFFPLGTWLAPGAGTLDGFARLSRKGEGILVIFRNESKNDTLRVELPAYPEGKFRVRSTLTGESLASITGEQMRRGVEFRVPAGHKVEVLEIRK